MVLIVGKRATRQDSTKMSEAERVLGPRWSRQELRAFYVLFASHGPQWERLAEQLPGRSTAMVRALFDMHRGYLSLPEASVEGFCTIMTDHYKNQDGAVGGRTQDDRSSGPDAASTPSHPIQAATKARDQLAVPMATALTPSLDAAAAVHSGELASRSLHETPPPTVTKKRRLEKLPAPSWDNGEQLELQTQEQLSIRSESDAEMGSPSDEGHDSTHADTKMSEVRSDWGEPSRKKRRLGLTRPRRVRSLISEVTFDGVHGKRFDLPWYCWFYACADAEFFRYNEFIDCLNRMGLGNIEVAARPVWSSVRSSMGRPRRLSPLFFHQEKLKLEEYRKSQRDHTALPDSLSYLQPVRLDRGTRVIVWMDMYQRFLVGTVVSVSLSESVCSVTTDAIGDYDEATLVCPLVSVMVLEAVQQAVRTKQISSSSTTTLLHRDIATHNHSRAMSALADSLPAVVAASVGGEYHERKLRAILAVKDLLYRKEKIVGALANLNEQVATRKRQVRGGNGLATSPWMTSPGCSSASLKDPSWVGLSEMAVFTEQQAWLAQNLELTNGHLREALLQLNFFSLTAENAGEHGEANYTKVEALDSPYAPDWTGSSGVGEYEQTMAVEEMRWAMDFLSRSKMRAAAMVDNALMTEATAVNVDSTLFGDSSELSRDVLPQTKQLVSSCLCLMSAFAAVDCAGADATSIPQVVLHNLVGRMLELVKPQHSENADLYAELKTAAEGIQAEMSAAMLHSRNERN